MLLVVADTSPIRYLVQIGHIDLLPRLFEKVLIPGVVADELRHPSAPKAVQSWMREPPGWLEILPAPELDDAAFQVLDPGERAAIALGLSHKADLILIDERKGAAVALRQGFETTGTLGILDLAARRGLVDIGAAIDRLKQTNFRYRQSIIDALLRQRE
jgi:predicted nucleic acid-binding protein